jgi:phosphohistidine phosphatase
MPTKTLFLLRHAKSSWKDSTLPDFERPINRHGQRAAQTMGQFIKNEGIAFDLILSSCATRARETAEIVVQTAKLRIEIRYDERIYEAGGARLLDVVSQIENDRNIVLLVGHNPAMEDLLQILSGRLEQLSTATLAKLVIKTTKWKSVSQKKAELEWLVRPNELEEAD